MKKLIIIALTFFILLSCSSEKQSTLFEEVTGPQAAYDSAVVNWHMHISKSNYQGYKIAVQPFYFGDMKEAKIYRYDSYEDLQKGYKSLFPGILFQWRLFRILRDARERATSETWEALSYDEIKKLRGGK